MKGENCKKCICSVCAYNTLNKDGFCTACENCTIYALHPAVEVPRECELWDGE